MKNTAENLASAEPIEDHEEAPVSGERVRPAESPETTIGTWESAAVRDIRGNTAFAADYAAREGAQDIAVRLQEDERKALDEIHAHTDAAKKKAGFKTIPTARIPGLREQPVVMPSGESKKTPRTETEAAPEPTPRKRESNGSFTRGATAGAAMVGAGAGASLFGIGRIFSWINAGLERLEKGNLVETMKDILLIPEKILDWAGRKLGIEEKKEKK